MSGRFFDPTNSYWSWLGKLTDVLALSLLWTFLSLPLFTLGAATTALYDSVAHCVRGGEAQPYARFFRTFKAEFKLSALTTLVWGVFLWVAFTGYRILYAVALERPSMAVPAIAYGIALVLPVGAACWLFPLLSRFTFSFRGLSFTAFQFTLAHLPSTVALVVILLGGVILCLRFPVFLLVVPCTAAWLFSLFVERAFRKHLPEPEEESDPDA